MSKVVWDMSMSLDGYVRASNPTPDEPLGAGGKRLHEWAFGEDERDREALAAGAESLGAIICGRRTYDESIRWWGADGPTDPRRLPVIVVTHRTPEAVPEGCVYTFVTDGIERALEQAKAKAGDKDVAVSGVSVGRQYVAAGLIDEVGIHLVPVLFGSGLRMFDSIGDEHIQLETAEVIETSAAIHTRFRVIRPDDRRLRSTPRVA